MNERHFESTERLPGLSDPVAAYEAGRALRMIGHIMDAEGSPPNQGQGFLSQLADAVLFFALRQERQPWGAEDTAFVFLERTQRPKEAIEAMLGVNGNQNIVGQYFSYWAHLVRGDFGTSVTFYPSSVGSVIRDSLPWTVVLIGVATVIS